MSPFELLPAKANLLGKVTQNKIARSCFVYACVFVMGCMILALSTSIQWHALAMGMLLPGGGFLAHANDINWQGLMHITLALCSLGLFMSALLLWFATGNALAPVLMWIFSALIAAVMPHSAVFQPFICGRFNFKAAWLLPGGLLLAIFCILLLALLKQSQGAKKRLTANLYLSTSGKHLAEKLDTQNDTHLTHEFSLDHLQQMRFLLDRALQPLENFDGFEWIDQFQTSAVRYQLNFMGYALSMAQATHLSAFSGYLSKAQFNLIQKQTDYRVWQYWQHENRWGNFQNHADPILRDNIMFTGFCATQIAMFHSVSGRSDFLNHHSFSLNHPSGQHYAYNQHLLVDKLHCELKQSDFHLMACEPNWVYPLCNTIGIAAIKHHNKLLWQQHEAKFTLHLEHEFIDLVGRFVPCRSSYTGLAIPVFGGALPQALPCFFLNATLPKIALRQWLLLRPTLLNGELLNRSAFWPIDTGNYGFSRAAAYAGTALVAKELGDGEIAHLCLTQLENEYPNVLFDGVMHRNKASVWAHAVEFLAISCTKNSFQSLIEKPLQSKQHPIISDVPYPDVLVAHASYQQGQLKVVLYHGTHAGQYSVGLAHLMPNKKYQCSGAAIQTIIADAHGNATLNLNIDGRTEIMISQKEGI